MTVSGAHPQWNVTDDLVDAVIQDVREAASYPATNLSERIDTALDRLDARHLDSLAYILSLVTLQVKRMASARGQEEDAAQEREHRERERERSRLLSPFDHPPQRRLG